MVDWRKAFNLISSRDNCKRSSPSRISDNSGTPRVGFEPAQNLSSDLLEWSCAVARTATPRRHSKNEWFNKAIIKASLNIHCQVFHSWLRYLSLSWQNEISFRYCSYPVVLLENALPLEQNGGVGRMMCIPPLKDISRKWILGYIMELRPQDHHIYRDIFWTEKVPNTCQYLFNCALGIPVDTGRKLNVHKTFTRRPGRLLNVLCTLDLRPVSTGIV